MRAVFKNAQWRRERVNLHRRKFISFSLPLSLFFFVFRSFRRGYDSHIVPFYRFQRLMKLLDGTTNFIGKRDSFPLFVCVWRAESKNKMGFKRLYTIPEIIATLLYTNTIYTSQVKNIMYSKIEKGARLFSRHILLCNINLCVIHRYMLWLNR